ncbi:hypothetical protein Tco_1427689 [Tanacetum coccineum]
MGYEMNAPGKSVDSFEEGEIIGESDDGCVRFLRIILMVIVVMIPLKDNADVNPSTNVSLEVNIPEVANDSSIVSPSTPPGNDLNIAKESGY